MKRLLIIAALTFVTFILPATGQSEVRLDGYLIAGDACPAYQSFRKKTNPGNIHLAVGMAYEVISKNKADATHYRIRVQDASPKERWVAASCGKLLVDCREQGGIDPVDPDDPVTTTGKEYLLALSWQPAFCQTHQHKKECESQTADRYDASHFSLHGLWPQPRSNIYCGVTNNEKKLDKRGMWEQLKALGLTEKTFSELMETMPGVASFLQRHEWTKHGTCYSTTAEEYFVESIMLADQVNESVVRDFFADNIDKSITSADVKAKFDAAFGAGAGNKVRVKCNSGMISELWINLKGEIEEDTSIKDLLKNAPPASSSCGDGLVDPVGF